MASSQKTNVSWLSAVEEHDYPAAESYLRLLYADAVSAATVQKLRHAAMTEFKAKDIFRASQLSLLGVSNTHVGKDRDKIEKGALLSPLLLVRDEAHSRLVVADGYHRLCAVYAVDEDALIQCKIVSI